MEGGDLWPSLLRYALGAVVIVAVFRLLVFRPADFVVSLHEGRTQYRGRLTAAHRRALDHFLLADLALQGPVTIKGARRGRRLLLWYHGALSPGQKQRIRNFWLTHVR